MKGWTLTCKEVGCGEGSLGVPRRNTIIEIPPFQSVSSPYPTHGGNLRFPGLELKVETVNDMLESVQFDLTRTQR